jgi:ribosomal protein L40E
MRSSVRARVVIAILLVLGSFLVSVQIGQVYAYHHHHHYTYAGYYYPYGYSGHYYSYPYYYNYGYSGYYYSSPYYYDYYYDYGYSNYKYQLTVNANPSSLLGQVSGGGSYGQGSPATFSSQNMIQVSKDTRYIFSHWSGDYSGSSSTGTVTMDASKTVTATYQLQYYLTVTVQPSNAPLSIGSAWYNAGEPVALTAPPQTVGGTDGTRLMFNGWIVDGNSQLGSSLNLQMDAPHTVAVQYKQQYYLTVSTEQGVPSGEGWYDAGTQAQISVSPPASPSYGVNIVFNGWQGDAQSPSQSTSVLMDRPKFVTATWRSDATVLYETIAVVLVAIALVAGTGFYSFTHKKSYSTSTISSSELEQKPSLGKRSPKVEYCLHCGVSLPVGARFCKKCGKRQV